MLMCGQKHRDFQPGDLLLVIFVPQHDFTFQPFQNGADDREPQPGSRFRMVVTAIKRFKYLAQRLLWNARSAVTDSDFDVVVALMDGDIDRTLRWCVANGVIDQIFQQCVQIDRREAERGISTGGQPDIDPFALRVNNRIRQHRTQRVLYGTRLLRLAAVFLHSGVSQ